MTEERFWNGTYRTMNAYSSAHKMKLEEQDTFNWMLGQYFACALNCTVGNMLKKEGQQLESYIEKPFMSAIEEENVKLVTDPEANERLAVEEMKARIRILQQQMGA